MIEATIEKEMGESSYGRGTGRFKQLMADWKKRPRNLKHAKAPHKLWEVKEREKKASFKNPFKFIHCLFWIEKSSKLEMLNTYSYKGSPLNVAEVGKKKKRVSILVTFQLFPLNVLTEGMYSKTLFCERLQINLQLNFFWKLIQLWFSLVWFYGISTIIGYLMPNPVFTYIFSIWLVNTLCRYKS